MMCDATAKGMAAPKRPAHIFWVMFAVSALLPLTTVIYIPSLHAIAGDLRCSMALATLTISVHALINGVQPVFLGPVSDRHGRRPLLLALLACHAVSSVACAFAPDIWVFLGCRVFQSVGSSSLIPIAVGVVRDTADARDARGLERAVGTLSIARAAASDPPPNESWS